ncbi:MAG: GNAT family N-acetyltransferase [Candidatus Caenarcaniphilales bacterium]|nr:GNAT family N-acetyltransferase [Candidatus Caenarcaniphilales bacterium]
MSANFDFSPYKLIDYSKDREEATIEFVRRGYASVGYMNLEPETIDNDLLHIEDLYKAPSFFKLLINESETDIDAKAKIIGSIALKVNKANPELGHSTDYAELKRVFIDDSLQGKGLGKKLSEFAFDYAKENGIKVIDIWSGTLCEVAHKLYQKLGAKNMGEMRFLGGIDQVYEKYFQIRF